MVKPRPARPTVQFVDTYCELYKDLFVEVRAYEYFKDLHVGLISDLKRKTLPAIAKLVGLENAQGLHHFLTESPWEREDLETRRLKILLSLLGGEKIEVIFDETGDKKKGTKTDYVKRQYIGNLGKIENRIVSVNAYGYWRGMTFPLKCKIFKPQGRLKEGDSYKTKPELAAEILRELIQIGFKIKRVLADSLYGESETNFLNVVEEFGIEYAVGIRSNHGVWLPKQQKLRINKWRKFEHIGWNSKPETRYIREIIYGKKGSLRYWEITTDKETTPSGDTWWVMTKIPGVKYKEVGGIYQVRSWIEGGFKNSKNELGWADFRVTQAEDIEKWWELVMSAYLMVCLHSKSFNSLVTNSPEKIRQHEWWNPNQGWKSLLNNLRLILEPFLSFNILSRWLKVFPSPQLSRAFLKLIAFMNEFDCLRYFVHLWDNFFYSSA